MPWTFFCLEVAVIMPSVVDLSVLIGIGGWVKPSSLRVMRRNTAFPRLCKITLTSYLAAEATTYLSILNSVWIDPFYGGGVGGSFLALAG